MRLQASLFGHNAPDWHALPVALRVGETNPNPATRRINPFFQGRTLAETIRGLMPTSVKVRPS